MARRPIILIHGYSSSGEAFGAWREKLQERGYDERDLHVLSYKSLTNEVTIDDLAEGFDRALRVQAGLDSGEDFDAVVHSTGMLVLRAWLTKFSARRERLRHLVALAPATFGSPLAHKGRGWLGGVFAGNREAGPDFMEAGDLILDGLELGSRYTWDLAHDDLVGADPLYGETRTTPYVFTFCGTEKYRGPARLVSEDGTDGTVRLAGCPLNTRKIVLDLTLPADSGPDVRVGTAAWSNADIPLVPIAGLDHGTIMSRPSGELVDLVTEALEVNSRPSFAAWLERARAHAKAVFGATPDLDRWQQLVFRVVDERGQPVPDYFIEFLVQTSGGEWQSLTDVHGAFKMHVHAYAADKSLRCFHVNLDSADVSGAKLGVRLIASSGTELLAYQGYVDDPDVTEGGPWNGVIDLSSLNKRVKFFFAFTTTLVEIRLNREPMPLAGFNELVYFVGGPERRALQKAQEIAGELRRRERDEARLSELTEQFEREVEAARGPGSARR